VVDGNWEISVTSPTRLEVDPHLAQEQEQAKLTPKDEGVEASTLSMDDCWTINIKAPASLCVSKGEMTEEGFEETIISENENEKGTFLCGPEWKVRITTKVGQELDVKQIEEEGEHRVLITPLPPKIEKATTDNKNMKHILKNVNSSINQSQAKTTNLVKKEEKKVAKKVVKVQLKKSDTRYLYSGGKIFFRECPLYHKVGWTSASA